jgi:hypothetical protein
VDGHAPLEHLRPLAEQEHEDEGEEDSGQHHHPDTELHDTLVHGVFSPSQAAGKPARYANLHRILDP